MHKLLITSVSSVLALTVSGVAAAAPPAWCKGAEGGSADMRRLSSKDPREVITAFVSAECSSSAEAEDHRAEVQKARQAWSRRLGMVEADWADAVAYAKANGDNSIGADISTKALAAATPIDQYAIILGTADPFSKMDPRYATDMFERNLSEVGRFAFLQTCFDEGRLSAYEDGALDGTEVPWAICQADFERFDLARFLAELHADRAHDGAIKMKLRVAAYDFPQQIKEHAEAVKKKLASDDGNKKLFEIAAAARAEWTAGIGKNAKLLDLVLAMESATMAQSRKQFEGCAETSQAALAEAVSEIPAKAFAGVYDDREDPKAGFGGLAGPVLRTSPAVTLAAIAHVLCAPDSDKSGFLSTLLSYSPVSRGPRTAAQGKIEGATFAYDSLKAKLSLPASKPYGGRNGTAFRLATAGGVITSLTPKGDLIEIHLEKLLVKEQTCVKAHSTGRVSRIRDNGSVEYERVCDKSGTMTQDRTLTGLEVHATYAPLLKPGMRVSTSGKDVIAVWPSKKAKAPSMVLGAVVK